MTTGRGMKEHMVTELPNGYEVSTLKIGKAWETMVFDNNGDKVYCHTGKPLSICRCCSMCLWGFGDRKSMLSSIPI